MSQVSGTDVPYLGRCQFMNLLTFGTITGVAAGFVSDC
jgi:cytochrome b6-f complex iron-sulfur subunit